jgi:hypothetical protein
MRAVWRAVAAIIAALLTLTLIDRFVLVEVLAMRIAAPLGLALLVAVAIVGAGSLVRRGRGGIALDFVIGYPIFGTLCFLVGVVKVNTLTMMVVTGAFAIAGVWAIRNSKSEIRNSKSDGDNVTPAAARPPGFLATLGMTTGMAAAIFVITAGFVTAQAPPHSLDELAYHLAIPHTWVLEGRAVELPLISHSYFPLGIESADLPLLSVLGAIGGGIASHFLHLIAAIATTLLIQKRTRDWLLTAAIVTTPALALTAGWSLVDWPLLGICVALLDDEERDGAVAAGLLTKYTFVPIGIVCAAGRIFGRRTAGEGARRYTWVLGCVFFVRNIILTGNPFAPFFGRLAPHVGHYRDLTLGSYIFDGRFIDESLGASLLAALTAISGPVAIVLLIAGALLWATAPSARILVPFFATAAANAKLDSRVLRVIVAIAVVLQLFLVAYFVDRTNVFSILAGKQSDEQFLTSTRASYAQIGWVNANLPAKSRTLVIGLNETYWFAHPVRGGGNFDGPRISAYLDVPTPEALRARIAHDGITHVAVFNEAQPATAVPQKQEERQTHLSPAAQRAVAQMLDRYAASVTSRGDVTLFTLR